MALDRLSHRPGRAVAGEFNRRQENTLDCRGPLGPGYADRVANPLQ